MTHENIESLAKASKELMLKEPFYGLFLMTLNKVWDPHFKFNGQGTAGVSLQGINYILKIEPTFWENLPAIQKIGILKHEFNIQTPHAVMHVTNVLN